jgi:hypothetical protein
VIAFTANDSAQPIGGVALHPASTVLYGTAAFYGAHNAGALWSITVGAGKPQLATLVAFGGAKDA